MKPQRKLVSLADELSALEQAVDGLRLMADALLVEHVGRQHDVERAPLVIASMTALIGARLKLVQRVVAGLADPATVHSRAINDVTGIDLSETGDMVLKEWSDDRVAERCRQELARLDAQATNKRARRKK